MPVSTSKPFKIICREEGNDHKKSQEEFATLKEALDYIKERWQGTEYKDGSSGFHTDYSTYQLVGFNLHMVGKYNREEWPEFEFFSFDQALIDQYVDLKVRMRLQDARQNTSIEQELANIFEHGVGSAHRMTAQELKAEIETLEVSLGLRPADDVPESVANRA